LSSMLMTCISPTRTWPWSKASMSDKYGKMGELTVRRGKKHDYLGMTLDFSEDGKFIFDMEEYLDKILNGLPEDMIGMPITPAADHLSKTCDDAPTLNKERAELLHRVNAQIPCVAQLGKLYLWTAISFLSKRVGEKQIR
jgi:hypothetical protein